MDVGSFVRNELYTSVIVADLSIHLENQVESPGRCIFSVEDL